MSKYFIGKNTLNKILSIIKKDLNKRIHEDNESSDDDVRRIWNDVTGADIPNVNALSHNHDELYALLSHLHDERYYTESEVNALLEAERSKITNIQNSINALNDKFVWKSIPVPTPEEITDESKGYNPRLIYKVDLSKYREVFANIFIDHYTQTCNNIFPIDRGIGSDLFTTKNSYQWNGHVYFKSNQIVMDTYGGYNVPYNKFILVELYAR